MRDDCERLLAYPDEAPLTPRMRLRPDGRLDVAVFCEDIACGGFENELESPPARFPACRRGTRVRSLAPEVPDPAGANGPAIVTFTLSAAGRAYVGAGGRPVCVSENANGTGYCMRVRRRRG